MLDKESRGPLIGLVVIGLVVLVMAVANMSSNLSAGGWYGADGVWHRVGGPPR